METQDWEGKALDKDLLLDGNKLYSPETCIFISKEVNSFLTDKKSNVGEHPLGVTYHTRFKKFTAQVWETNGQRKHLGYFDTPEAAAETYKAAKWEIAQRLARKQTDKRVADAILKRYEYKG